MMTKEYKHIKRFILFIVMGLSCLCGNALTVLQQADSAYNAQDFRAALNLYNQALETQGSSSNLYYNIGNANYRIGNVGHAIVNYERALRLDPSNDDARVNLEFVNSNIKDLPEDGNSFLNNLHNSIVSYASPDAWGIITLVLFLMILGCVTIYLFSSHTTLRKIGFFTGIGVLVLFVYSFIIAWQTASAPQIKNTGIVVKTNSRITSNPGTGKNKEDKALAIPEGAKVEITDSLSIPEDPIATRWYNIELNNNTTGWIDASAVEII